MKHQDYFYKFKYKGEFDGDCYIIWLNKDFWEVLPGYYTDILGALMSKDLDGGYGVSFLISTPDDRQQQFVSFGYFPLHIQKNIVNYIKNY